MSMRITEEQAKKMGIWIKPENAKAKTKAAQPVGDSILFEKLCAAHGLPIPEPEYEFCPGRKWRFDYLFEGFLALEKEGGMFGRGPQCPTCHRRGVGAHTSIKKLLDDIEKYNAAACLGFTVIRAIPDDFESGKVFELVRRALYSAGEQS